MSKAVKVVKGAAKEPVVAKLPSRMSQMAYARHRGTSTVNVHRAIEAGRIHAEPDGQIDPVRADAEWAETTTPTDTPSTVIGPDGKKVSFAEARTTAELLRQQKERMRMAKMSGELVDKTKALAVFFGWARRERDAWNGWPARVAALLAAELGVDAHVCELALDRFVSEHLKSLSDVTIDLR